MHPITKKLVFCSYLKHTITLLRRHFYTSEIHHFILTLEKRKENVGMFSKMNIRCLDSKIEIRK